jgi:hypothetical protein
MIIDHFFPNVRDQQTIWARIPSALFQSLPPPATILVSAVTPIGELPSLHSELIMSGAIDKKESITLCVIIL